MLFSLHGYHDGLRDLGLSNQGCILSPCLFNLCAKYIMRNTGLEEAQAGIKIDGKIWINVRYADDTTFRQKAKN